MYFGIACFYYYVSGVCVLYNMKMIPLRYQFNFFGHKNIFYVFLRFFFFNWSEMRKKYLKSWKKKRETWYHFLFISHQFQLKSHFENVM